MELELGRRTFDVTTRTLVMGVVSPDGDAAEIEALVEQRPALLLVHAEDQLAVAAARFEGPVAIRTDAAVLAARCLRAGAIAAHDPSGFSDPSYLDVINEAGAAVIVTSPDGAADPASFLTERAQWAAARDIPASRVVIDVTGLSGGERRRFQALGHPLMGTTTIETDAAGRQVLHAMHGVRIIATSDVQRARRTVDTVAELLERRAVAV